MFIRFLFVLVSLFLFNTIEAQLPQFRGENRDGIFKESGLLKSWPKKGPELLFNTEGIGKGYSSAVVAHDLVYISGMIDTLDYLTALDLTGEIKWQVPYGRSWLNSFPDTRSTPTIEEDRIYIISGIGEMVCLNAHTGDIFWKVNVDEKYGADWHRWGVSESPLIVDNKVICSPAGENTLVVALDKMTGKTLWKSKALGGSRSYMSPVLYEYKGSRYILAMDSRNLVAIQPENGEVIWQYTYYNAEWTEKNDLILPNSPIFKEDEIFISMGYDYPAVMLKINPDGKGVSQKWVNKEFDNHHHGFVYIDGYIYGSNWIGNRMGNWLCLDWDTGEIKYNIEWKNKGSIIYADGLLYCYEEKAGNVALVKTSPENFEIVSSFKIESGTGPHWAHPSIFDGILFIRHGEVLMGYNVKPSS